MIALVVLGGTGVVSSIGLAAVNVVLADLTEQLGATTADLQWVVNAYTLVFALGLMAASAMGDRYGARRVLRIGLVISIVGSVGAAFSPTTAWLIGCRALMGLGAATVTPTSLAIVTELFPSPKERARAFGVWAGVGSLGLAIGPVVGGTLLDHFWWGSAFLAGAPVLLVILAATWIVLPRSAPPTEVPLDWQGAALATAGLGLVVWAIIQGPVRGWTDPTLLGAGIVAVALLATFAAWERHTAQPMLDLTHLRRRTVALPLLSAAMTSFALAGMLLGVSLLYRSVFGYSPLRTGLALVPLSLIMALTSALGPRLSDRVGTDKALAASLLTVSLGCVLLAGTHPASGSLAVIVATSVLGAGFGLGVAPATTSVIASFPPDRAGVGSGVTSTLRQTGFLLGVAVLGSVLSTVYRSDVGQAAIGAGLRPSDVQTAKDSVAGALRLSTTVGDEAALTLRRAALDAFTHGLRAAAIGGAIAAALTGLVALVPRRRGRVPLVLTADPASVAPLTVTID
ncbi:MAG: putative transporter [Actinomycetia bacterium]|nr:putative transporter [Actinomycetes bacterium]